MREGVSLKHACEEHGVDPRTAIRLAASVLRKSSRARYQATASDNLFRVLNVPIFGGLEEYVVRGSRTAGGLGRRGDAQKYFLATGDDSNIRRLSKTKLVDASGHEIPFLTDLDELERLGSAGVLSFESIYARTA